MICSLLFMSFLLAGAPDGDEGAVARLREYRSAAAVTRHDPDAHVRLALWCEAHGLTAERLKHLSLAVLYDPANVLARGLMGLVAYRGKWERPDEVSRRVEDDPETRARIKEYLKRRVQLGERADDHWKLALWCEQNGLEEQASAHLHQVLRFDPKRENAWKHLGYKRVGGRWTKPEVAAAAKAEAQQQQQANNHWRPILEKLRNGLRSKDASRRAEAEKALAQITDRRAVPMVWATFGRGEPALQQVAVQVLGQIDDPSASRALVMLAVFGGSANVRRKAVETLRHRDAREFAGLLIAMIQRDDQVRGQAGRGPGPAGRALDQGQQRNAESEAGLRRRAPPSVPCSPAIAWSLDSNGLPVINRPEIDLTKRVVQSLARCSTRPTRSTPASHAAADL